MNSIAEEIRSYMGVADDPELLHYGTPRHSGRYPWGSGENPYQHTGDFLSRVESLKKEGLTEKEIADSLGLTTTQLRVQKSLAKNERRALDVATVKSLRADGLGWTEIGRIMGKSESTIRSLFDTESEARMNQAMKTAEFLKDQINKKGIIDVGPGVELELGVSPEMMKQALTILEMQGAKVFTGGVPNITNPGKQINTKVVIPPGMEAKDFYAFTKGEKNIASVTDYISYDGGQSFKPAFVYPESLSSKRLMVRYDEDGGTPKDGVIELRRGVEDISLGDARYSQVRIMVDGTHYLKGMAIYGDDKDFPPGVDVIFNTNKSSAIPALGEDKNNTVLKKIKDDPDNPFGSKIKEQGGQRFYDDPNGKYTDEATGKKQSLSVINKRADEGDWSEWKDKVPSQFLSKQSLSLARKQLGLATTDKQAEFDEICALTNPTVKKSLLMTFSEDCDSAAVHLQAAALPRQKYQVIIPVNSLKDNEVYAPNFNDGEKVALIRYPHGGIFEIPVCTVNNKHAGAQKIMGSDWKDAIGVNSKVAEQLSGADFDGDTVMVIPTSGNGKNTKVKITNMPRLKQLEGFDPKLEYGGKEEGTFKVMKNTQTEMGKISNLITDMTIKGASWDELALAVRHSMVVIDAEKHQLDYKQSEIDHNIAALKKKYQGRVDEDGRYREGASTIISRAKSEVQVNKRQGQPKIDPETGKLVYKDADDLYYTVTKTNKRTGEVTTETRTRHDTSTAMAETDDAYTLVSSKGEYEMETLYADYANTMKSLANQARLELLATPKLQYSPSAKKTYQAEVDSLNEKLETSLRNAPKERQAQLIANAKVNAKKQANPDMSNDEIKKHSQQALSAARAALGAKRTPIDITDREWEAIQAGAISESKLEKILKYADTDTIRERATPRNNKTAITSAQASRIKAMLAAGYTTAELADKFGVSASTISKYSK